MKVSYISLGCPKNSIDLETILGGLTGGAEVTPNPAEADAVIVNTCAFIHPAKEESIETILEVARLKKRKERLKLLVTGCLPQRYRNELAREMPEVDAFFFSTDVETTRQEVRSFLQIAGAGEARYRFGAGHYAYLRIADGCDNRCHYCAIPLIKGGYQSRSIDEIVTEAGQLAASGAVELLLVAQDTTYYGRDRRESNSLHRLLELLAEIDGIRWIRLLYTHPAHWYPELVDAVAKLDKVVKYIDLPIQHIADPVLARMGRTTSRAQIERLIACLRQSIPDLALRTSLIVGHPGETEYEFNELLRFIEQTRFERLGVFTYSAEEGTKAAVWSDDLPDSIKAARRDEIMELQAELSEERNQALIGQEVTVLIDEYDADRHRSIGRTPWDAPEIDNSVTVAGRFSPGTLVQARVVAADIYDLAADPI